MKSNTNLVQIAPSSRSRELERELSLADERCRLLEERLNTMRQNYARAESDRNQEFEGKLGRILSLRQQKGLKPKVAQLVALNRSYSSTL